MKVILEAYAGSKLFGTDGPTSDVDIKGIYLPSKEDILLGQIKHSIKESTNPSNEKNRPGDIDKEYCSISKFLRMLQEGQTVALELLFTPDNMIIQKDEMWDHIVANRDKLVHKGVLAFIGYAKQQSAKYGLRGTRLGAMKSAMDLLTQKNQHDKLDSIVEELEELTKREELVEVVQKTVNKNMQNIRETYLKVCGSHYGMSTKIGYTLKSIETNYATYGERARLAAENKGIDYKSLSHAVRVIGQGKELLSTGRLTLPRPDADLLRNIKYGKVEFKEIQRIIESGLEDLNEMQKISALPSEIKPEFINDMICSIHSEVVLFHN
jgi:predicted nucleotidyltransferase